MTTITGRCRQTAPCSCRRHRQVCWPDMKCSLKTRWPPMASALLVLLRKGTQMKVNYKNNNWSKTLYILGVSHLLHGSIFLIPRDDFTSSLVDFSEKKKETAATSTFKQAYCTYIPIEDSIRDECLFRVQIFVIDHTSNRVCDKINRNIITKPCTLLPSCWCF